MHAHTQNLQWTLPAALNSSEVLKVEVYDHETVGRNRYSNCPVANLRPNTNPNPNTNPTSKNWLSANVWPSYPVLYLNMSSIIKAILSSKVISLLVCSSSGCWGHWISVSVKWFQRGNRVWTMLSSPRRERLWHRYVSYSCFLCGTLSFYTWAPIIPHTVVMVLGVPLYLCCHGPWCSIIPIPHTVVMVTTYCCHGPWCSLYYVLLPCLALAESVG